ncbi:DUF3012 domain-containing protein [Shewanella sp. VB17]|uniref:DUF3012 domain-containing protein n=1 Tax=Shewanella sp. VB17 TaxID=2739432 RepID=UPI0015672CC9|nr:DUF3012 domain-containing protein [Shewanella sp. VB17]
MLLSLPTQLIKALFALIVGVFMMSLSGCAQEVGDDEWCKLMSDKAKGDWSVNEAADYAKHCVFK